MADSLLTKAHLSDLLDECAEELNSGVGSKLNDLAQVFHSLAQARDDSISWALPQSIGTFAGEVTQFQSLVALPILIEPIRSKCKAVLDNAVKDGTEALKIIRKQLCEENNPDCEAIIKAMALFNKNSYKLYSLRSQFMRARPPREEAEE